MSELITGVECAVCHQETFRVHEREVLMMVQCCPECTNKIDAENEDKPPSTKAERRIQSQIKSHEWGDYYDGQRVELRRCVRPGAPEQGVLDHPVWTGTAKHIQHTQTGKERAWSMLEIKLDKGQSMDYPPNPVHWWAGTGFDISYDDEDPYQFYAVVSWGYHWLVSDLTKEVAGGE